MAEHRIGSAVVTRRSTLAGVFMTNDVCRAFADFLEHALVIDDEDDAA